MIPSMASDPNASTMNVSLPKPLKRYVEGKVSSGVYGSASEFVREAIREKFQREREGKRTTADLTAKLIEGLDSGEPIEFTDDYFAQKKRSLVSRVTSKRKRS